MNAKQADPRIANYQLESRKGLAIILINGLHALVGTAAYPEQNRVVSARFLERHDQGKECHDHRNNGHDQRPDRYRV